MRERARNRNIDPGIRFFLSEKSIESRPRSPQSPTIPSNLAHLNRLARSAGDSACDIGDSSRREREPQVLQRQRKDRENLVEGKLESRGGSRSGLAPIAGKPEELDEVDSIVVVSGWQARVVRLRTAFLLFVSTIGSH